MTMGRGQVGIAIALVSVKLPDSVGYHNKQKKGGRVDEKLSANMGLVNHLPYVRGLHIPVRMGDIPRAHHRSSDDCHSGCAAGDRE